MEVEHEEKVDEQPRKKRSRSESQGTAPLPKKRREWKQEEKLALYHDYIAALHEKEYVFHQDLNAGLLDAADKARSGGPPESNDEQANSDFQQLLEDDEFFDIIEEMHLQETQKITLWDEGRHIGEQAVVITEAQRNKLLQGKDDVVLTVPVPITVSTTSPSLSGALSTNSASLTRPLIFHFLDVGQGNGTLIECPNGELILVDYGTARNSGTTADPTADFIRTKCIDRQKREKTYKDGQDAVLDYLVISHADKDHVNLVCNLHDVKFGKVICGGLESHYNKADGKNFKAHIKQAAQGRHDLIDCLLNDGDLYSEAPDSKPADRRIQCKGVDVWIVAANAPQANLAEVRELRPGVPANDEATKTGSATNSASVVLAVRYGGTQVLICADATFSTDHAILNDEACAGWPSQLQSYALSGGHHGAKFSFSEAFLKAVNPQWIHFSADLADQFMHPNWSLIQRVLRQCPLLGAAPAYGPHGIVFGRQKYDDRSRDISDEELRELRSLDESLRLLAEWKDNTLTRLFPSKTIGWKETLFWFCKEMVQRNLEAAGLMAEMGGLQVLDKQGDMSMSPGSEDEDDSVSGKSEKDEEDEKDKDEGPEEDEPDDEGDDTPWLKEVHDEMLDYLGTSNIQQVTIDFVSAYNQPLLLHWTQRFEEMDAERLRLERKKDKYEAQTAHWHWYTTAMNIYTAMETANLGVYWILEIDANGVPYTDRT